MVRERKYYPKLTNPIVSKEMLIEKFKELGINKGMIVYVQSSLDYFSNVVGGNQSIIEALQEIVSFDGGIVVNSACDSFDPMSEHLDVPLYQYDMVRESMPAFNKKRSLPKYSLSRQLLTYDGICRSNHPTSSFIAWGKYAKVICDKHQLHFAYGKDSPIVKLADLNGYVLLLGTKYENCDIFKAARINDRNTPIKIVSAPIEKRGRKSFINMLDYEYEEKDIIGVKDMLEERQLVKEVFVSRARCRLFNAKEALTLARAYYVMKGDE